MSKYGSTAPLKTPKSTKKGKIKKPNSASKTAATTEEVKKRAGTYMNQTTDSQNK